MKKFTVMNIEATKIDPKCNLYSIFLLKKIIKVKRHLTNEHKKFL